MKRSDLVGQTFGKLKVIEYAGAKNEKSFFLCECSCAAKTQKVIMGANLKKGTTVSCGCFQKEQMSKRATERQTKHGMATTPTYRTWAGMLARCHKDESPSYPSYGGRGIQVCERWKKFESFCEDMGERPADSTLDRIDSNGNYEKDNCRWATNAEQHANKRNSVKITYNGETRTPAEWSQITGIDKRLIRERARYGWDAARILTPRSA